MKYYGQQASIINALRQNILDGQIPVSGPKQYKQERTSLSVCDLLPHQIYLTQSCGHTSVVVLAVLANACPGKACERINGQVERRFNYTLRELRSNIIMPTIRFFNVHRCCHALLLVLYHQDGLVTSILLYDSMDSGNCD